MKTQFTENGFIICPQCKKNNDEAPIIIKRIDHYHCTWCLFDWVDMIEIIKVRKNEL